MELLFTIGLTFPDPYPHGITFTGRVPTPDTRFPVRGEVVELRGRNGERVRATVRAVAGPGFWIEAPARSNTSIGWWCSLPRRRLGRRAGGGWARCGRPPHRTPNPALNLTA